MKKILKQEALVKRTRTLIFGLALLMAVGAGLLATADAGQTVRIQKEAVIPIELVPLTEAEKDMMIFIYQEEKLARDIYMAMNVSYPNCTIFANIALSEVKHMEAVRKLLDRYVTDEELAALTSLNIGFFLDQELQELYGALLAQGGLSVDDAYAVGETIENKDIEDLTAALAITLEVHLDILSVYTKLRDASYSHLEAFLLH
jgi:hypothetical protein